MTLQRLGSSLVKHGNRTLAAILSGMAVNSLDYGEGEAGFNNAMTSLSESGGGLLVVTKDITFTSLPIQHKPMVTVVWEAKAIVKTGLTAEYAYVINGGAGRPIDGNEDHFKLANKTNCYNLRLEAEDRKVGIDAKGVLVRNCYGYTYEGGAILGFNNGGFTDDKCYDAKASKFTMAVSNKRKEDAVGLYIGCTDGWYSEISSVGYATGCKVVKSGNSLDKFHPWGNTVTNRVGIMGKMHIGLEITQNGGFTRHTNLILDTPVRRNTNSPPSRTNGGVGLILDAWDTTIEGCLVLPSLVDTVAKSTLLAIITGQKCAIKDLHTSKPDNVNDVWVSWEQGSGISKNEVTGTGYAQRMRTGGNIGSVSGVSLEVPDGCSVSGVSLQSGINDGNLYFNWTGTVIAPATATQDVVMKLSETYGVTRGAGGFIKGGTWTFETATVNTGKKLLQVTAEVVDDNSVKFLLSFEGGSERYARWSDMGAVSPKVCSLNGNISIH